LYNLKEIKSIPLADVARRYGINLVHKHGRLWGKLRPEEKTSSFSINLSKNLWYDFGAYKGGSAIDLVMELDGIDKTEAINKLAEDFGIENETVKGWSPLTDAQYRELGIEPTSATLNFNYDLRVHTLDQLTRWNAKYGMPVQKLAKLHPERYNKLVNKIGQESINSFREAYFLKIKNAVDPLIPQIQQRLYKSWAVENAKEINAMVDLLSKAIKEDSIGSLTNIVPKVNALAVNPEKDMAQFFKKISINAKEISEDQKIRNNVVNAYKSQGLKFADYLTVAAAKALLEFNKAFTDGFMPVNKIKSMYKLFGSQLSSFEDMQKELNNQVETFQIVDKFDIQKIRELFQKASAAVDGLREAGMEYKRDLARQNEQERGQTKIRGDDMAIIEH